MGKLFLLDLVEEDMGHACRVCFPCDKGAPQDQKGCHFSEIRLLETTASMAAHNHVPKCVCAWLSFEVIVVVGVAVVVEG
jgi:hypothetical protein